MRRTILVFSLFALVLASCGGGTEEAKLSGSTTRGASASVAITTGSPTASPTAEVNPDYEVPPYEVPPYAELVKLFDYDASEPLGYEVLAKERQEGATVYDVEYRSSG